MKTISKVLALAVLFWGTSLGGPQAGEFSFSRTDPRFSLQQDREASGTGIQVALSMDDLGFSKEQTQADPKLQKDLEARSDMLQIHQTLGLITCIPMVTNYVLGLTSEVEDDLLLHGGLGFATAGMYLTTASFAIFAPHVKGAKTSGNSDLHQLLAILHGACMVATPILGEMAEHEGDSYKTAHFVTTTTLVASYVTAMALMTF